MKSALSFRGAAIQTHTKLPHPISKSVRANLSPDTAPPTIAVLSEFHLVSKSLSGKGGDRGNSALKNQAPSPNKKYFTFYFFYLKKKVFYILKV